LVTFKDNWYGGSFSDKVVRVGVTRDVMKDTSIRSLAVEIFNKLRVKGYTRVDFREKSGKLFILELNSNPALGWTEEWDFIKVCAEAAGMTYTDVLKLVISGARPGV
jgi:D-alanine-D-alanine ligase-like ATP-grasp enzyme